MANIAAKYGAKYGAKKYAAYKMKKSQAAAQTSQGPVPAQKSQVPAQKSQGPVPAQKPQGQVNHAQGPAQTPQKPQVPANQRNSVPPPQIKKDKYRRLLYSVGNKGTGIVLILSLVLMANLAMMGTILFFMLTFYECQSETNESCPYGTCAVKDDKCEYQSFFYKASGEKICIDGGKVYGPD